jgi:hypothetical protein
MDYIEEGERGERRGSRKKEDLKELAKKEEK